MKYTGLLLIIIMALTLTGCGKTTSEVLLEESMEAAMGDGNVDVEMEGDEVTSMTIDTEDGEVTFTTGGNDVPEGYPSEIPYYKGEITSSGSTSMGTMGFDSYSMTIETKDSAEEVVAFYIEELEKDGWSKTVEINDPESGTSMLAWLKNAMDQVNVSIVVEDGKAEITQTVVIEMTE
jgi:hypothetical protein